MKKFMKALVTCTLSVILLIGCTKPESPLDIPVGNTPAISDEQPHNVSSEDPSNQPTTLRIATFNIEAKAHPDIEAIRTMITEHDIEIFGLQEVDQFTQRNPVDTPAEFTKTPYDYNYYSIHFEFNGGNYGLATISQYPFLTEDTTRLYSGEYRGEELLSQLLSAYKNYDQTDEASVEILDAVFENDPIETRVIQRVTIEKDGKEIAIYNVHLNHEDKDLRKLQLDFLVETMNNDPCEYKIVLGDFNTDQSIEEWDGFLSNGYLLSNGKDGKWIETCDLDPDMVIGCIDNIVVSPNIEIKEVTTLQTDLSDHNPIFALLEFK